MNTLKFAFRKLFRNKYLLYVGIPGLAIGLATVLLLASYLKRELSFDKHFSTKDRVVRIFNTAIEGETGTYGICLRKAYDEIPSQIAEVEAATQIYNGWGSKLTLVKSNQTYKDLWKLYVDKEYLQVFDQHLIVGDKKNALKGKNKIVLTKSTALKLFGNLNCLNEQINMGDFGDPNFVVSGIVEDLPSNSHIKYDFLVSMETLPLEMFGGLEFQTYFLVKDNTDIETASEKIAKANDAIMQPWLKNVGVKTISETALLKDMHFFSKSQYEIIPTANIRNLWLVGIIALLVLLIALVNFINLYSLHNSSRIGEISMRKSLGANRFNLVYLFFSDTFIMSFIALLISFGLISLVAPYFSQLIGSNVTLSELFSVSGIAVVMGILLLVVISSSTYPLLSLSKVNLALGVKGKTDKVNRKNYATEVALLVQFSVTAFLLAGIIIFYTQVDYMKSVPLGFNANNLEGFYLTSRSLVQQADALKIELEKFPFVESVASSHHSMGGGVSGQVIHKYGDAKNYPINEYRVRPGFAKTMQLELIAGEYFNPDNAGNEIILNEAAVKKMELDNPVGKKMVYMGKEPIVKGVVKDFYYTQNSGQLIEPIVLSAYLNQSGVIYVRTHKPMTSAQKMEIVNTFKKFDDTYTLNSYNVALRYAQKFKDEDRLMKMIGFGALLAILLSISGLVALSLINVNRRTKEIGVRKVMGSTENQILTLLIKQVLYWILFASLFGFLVNYYVMQKILQNFVNRIDIGVSYFIISGGIILIISIISVGWQSYRAASRNPVEALRYE